MTSAPTYLIRATETRSRELLDAVEALSEEQAAYGRQPDWPTHEYHVGQDGSIAGIVHHLAAWKAVYVELLRGSNLEPADLSPPAPGFQGLVAWLRRVTADWLQECTALSDEQLEQPITVPGVSSGLTPCKMMSEMLEHDIEHLGQINYLIEAQKCAANRTVE
jgi:uncharacterized damage-inducible protein DinB